MAVIAGQLVVGGAERQLYLWLANLDRDRFEPMVVTLKATPGDYWEEPIRALGIPLVRDAHSGNRALRLAALTRLLSSWKPDIVHGWHLFASPYAGATARILGSASLGSLRSSARSFETNYWEGRLSERLVDGMVINSESAASELAQSGRCRRQRMFVVPNAVEADDASRGDGRTAMASALRLDPHARWIGAMGRMVEGKGFETLLRVFAKLHATQPGTSLVLFGDGPLRSVLEAQAVTLGLADAVRFVGEVPDARRRLAALDVFCFLSEDEGMPNAVLEAASSGVAIAGWRTRFLEEATGTGGGALVPSGDLDALQATLSHLIEMPDHGARMGRTARAHVMQRFGVEQYVRRMTAAYDDVSA